MQRFTLYVVIISLLSIGQCLWAQEQGFKNETGLGIVLVSGNADSTTSSLKQLSTYVWDLNKVQGTATFTETESESVTTAKQWDAAGRYQRELSERLGAYTAYTWESNRFAGYLQRETAELGATYKLAEGDAFNWSADLAYSHRETNLAESEATESSPGAIIGTRLDRKIREGLSGEFWARYRQDFSGTRNHTFDLEPSLVVLMTEIISLKLSYLVKSQARVNPPATEHTDTTFTTNLVAKF